MAGDQGPTLRAAGEASQIGGEVTWKGPAVSMAAVRFMAVVPGALAVLWFGYPVLGEVIAVDQVRTYLQLAVAGGAVFGGAEGWLARRSLAGLSALPDQPLATPAWSQVVGRWRPRPLAVLGVVFLMWLVLTGGIWYGTFLAAYLMASTVVAMVIWIPKAVRWEAVTGRTVLVMRNRGGRTGIVTTLPAADIETIVAGELGDQDREWLLGLLASLHFGGRYHEAAALGDHLYARWCEPFDAYNTACSLVRAGNEDLAVEYLGEALRGGFGRKEMVKDKDLAPLLPRPEVMELYKATRPQPPSALDVGTPPGDGVGESFVHGGRLDSEGGGRSV